MSRSCPPAAPQRLRPSFARRFAVPFAAVLVVGGLALPWAAHAQEATGPGQEAVSDVESPFAIHGQTTYIWQRKPSFGAGYSGENSLTPDRAKSYSFTATLDLGLRLWQGAEFHFNPEVAQGVPFSELHGVGGPSNLSLIHI